MYNIHKPLGFNMIHWSRTLNIMNPCHWVDYPHHGSTKAGGARCCASIPRWLGIIDRCGSELL